MAIKRKKLSIAVTLITFIFALQFASQTYAKYTNYHRSLSNPLLVIKSTPIYPFYSFFIWGIKGFFKNTPIAFDKSMNSIFLSVLVGFIILIFLNKSKKQLDSHGTARWGTKEDLKKAELYPNFKKIRNSLKKSGMWKRYSKVLPNEELKRDGVVLGLDDKKNEILDSSVTHITLMAPTRSGKGVGVIIPTLLTWKHSTVVNDIKGENFQLTAAYREKVLGHKCFKFDPTNPYDSCRYNPLREIRKGTVYEYQDSMVIAEIVCSAEKEDHWTISARKIFSGVLMHILYIEEEPTIGKVLKFLTDPSKNLEEKMEEIIETKHTDDSTLFEKIYNDTTKVKMENEEGDIQEVAMKHTHPKASREAGDIISKPDKERESIMSSLISMLGVYADPIIDKNTSSSDFSIKDLMNDEVPLNLYLVTPPKAIKITAPVFRLMIAQIINGLTDEMDFSSGTENKGFKHRLLLLLDEFPALGKIPIVETALAYIAGYGMKALIITQDINQINRLYTKNNSILSNCHINMFFTPSKGDYETPKIISNALGTKTIEYQTKSFKGIKYFSDWNHTEHIASRNLLTVGEVGTYSMDKSLILVTGEHPIQGTKVRYFKDPKYLKKIDKKTLNKIAKEKEKEVTEQPKDIEI
ncbi:type IV secretory system conjugative DNA transfer family protein [Psychrilyobacter atlanticus]|uniref:type IV secretory system conjugative DNA transfer family protein n=1 Tax=Psychrilyobacter atlanticus TaxID=271091 RepID=UPI0004066929|nr:type IV secretory system conjugative DNA transfer family protein [Psychrilyobacter atlanticus]